MSFFLAAAGCSSKSSGGSSSPSPPAACGTTALDLASVPAEPTQSSYSIYDGQAIPSSTIPFVGGLLYVYNGTEGLCSASLICPNVILTAAHCVAYNGTPTAPASTYHFSLATVMPFTGSAGDQNNLPSDAVGVAEIQIAPGWAGSQNTTSSGPDMAILHLTGNMVAPLAPLAFTPMPEPTTTAGVPATIVGYGESIGNDGSVTGLYGAGTKRDGALAYEGSIQADSSGPADPGTLLTLSTKARQDTCEGDSGGPLLINNSVYGTLSGGDTGGCGVAITNGTDQSGQAGYSFYSSVPNNKAWIQGFMQTWCGTITPTAIQGASACSAK